MFRLENVSKIYEQKDKTVAALHPTALTIGAGEFVTVVGASGSGKSTLLTLLGGMLAPSAGRVWFNGQSLYELDMGKRAQVRRLQMGFIFQSFNLVPYLSAQDNVAVPLLLRGDRPALQRQRARELLDRVGLADRAQHKPSQLSIGQQQRVALARALVNDPRVILADEPTGNLDPNTRQQVFSFFDDFHRDGKTIIMVTHDPDAARRGTRTLHVADGHITSAMPAEMCQVA